MTPLPSQNAWFSPQVDPEHILGNGFKVALSGSRIHIVDPDADTPPPLVLRSAWGRATEVTLDDREIAQAMREHSPYDFHSSMFAGAQLWNDRALTVPAGYAELAPSGLRRFGRGAYVGPTDDAPSFADVMEFVFLPAEVVSRPPPEVFMAQVLLDLRPPPADLFVVAAIRILEPLLVDLRRAVEEANNGQLDAIGDLRMELDQLDANLRQLHEQPSKLRAAVQTGLAALGAIVLNIVANRLDPVFDHVDWPGLWNTIEAAVRRLGLS
jgi:hypothetical protein